MVRRTFPIRRPVFPASARHIPIGLGQYAILTPHQSGYVPIGSYDYIRGRSKSLHFDGQPLGSRMITLSSHFSGVLRYRVLVLRSWLQSPVFLDPINCQVICLCPCGRFLLLCIFVRAWQTPDQGKDTNTCEVLFLSSVQR